MALQIWNADRALKIDARGTSNIHCVGAAITWGRPPIEIYDSKLLSRLAKLSLCEGKHKQQKDDLIDQRNVVIDDVALRHEQMERLRKGDR